VHAPRGLVGTAAVSIAILVAINIAWPLAGAQLARAADPEPAAQALDLYELGMAHFRARSFGEAARAFEAAYAIDPRREVLFALAQATRLSGDCPAAVPLYQKFLATRPPDQQVEATRLALARCEERASPPAPLTRPAPPAAVRTAPADPAASRWYRDPAASALAAAGVLTLGAGVGLYVASRMADGDHRQALVYGRADERRSVALDRRRWAAGALLSSAALGLAAAGRWAWLRWSPGRAGVGVGGSF
jgi:tetratricopeptide (TPR) repeat protein